MGNEYYVVTTIYCFDRAISEKEHVFRTYAAAKKFYDEKKKEYSTPFSDTTVKEIETRYFED